MWARRPNLRTLARTATRQGLYQKGRDKVLVLKRLERERIILRVGDVEIIVSVQEVNRNTVKLGFVAPPEVVIHREELLRQLERQSAGVPPAGPA